MHTVEPIALDAQAGNVSVELPAARLAQAGGGFAWLTDEPDLYTDADLAQPQG